MLEDTMSTRPDYHSSVETNTGLNREMTAPETTSGMPQRDPVCWMDVLPEEAAATHAHGGKTYYFCNAMCAERFVAERLSTPVAWERMLGGIRHDPRGGRFSCGCAHVAAMRVRVRACDAAQDMPIIHAP